ncbi:tRNA (adenosine(37)-N6)-threonylcarbamoyltransferase complex dimerization subunit type 1 TsaB [Bacillus shivajii]|uniref:tRNA (adenosine(37)-N6)-threonylcarbamoyltransferase complex dimerization subunit type 1 TsaB n=1 Tax=Bacillus shivajii TaxID=1983719 RepID=UPI001CF9453B|nr:tRNA (adenosine(37)-N6)-threonylcarbamoyltransferase complex dimerization subunit type 1 TsaB [Bacillus shivajii]UCZ53700.1 tRNA (adenosine(37)-N6)-threonylcarbamoyltransferase complex dimerization subunit type 1 TsaB [Bacillus shivajii]
MNVLAIDTSTYVMGVAVLTEGKVAGEFVTHIKKNHSLRLMPAIRTLMEEIEMSPKDLDRIVVNEGPGSYTGVRIGVTTAKTMAWSLNIPVVGVSSIEVMAQNGKYFPGVISPFIDARRGQVFTGLYQYEGGSIVQKKEDQIIQHKEWLEDMKQLDEDIIFISPEMEKQEEVVRSLLGDRAHIAEPAITYPRPSELAYIGSKKEVDQFTHLFSPNYLRLAEAEAKWLAENKQK